MYAYAIIKFCLLLNSFINPITPTMLMTKSIAYTKVLLLIFSVYKFITSEKRLFEICKVIAGINEFVLNLKYPKMIPITAANIP